MKKIIAITLACMLLFSSLLLTSCDERVDNNKKAEQTTAQTQSNAQKEEKPRPVTSVKGKNARQLFEEAMTDYSQSKSFDISMSMETTEEGVKKTEKIDMKLSESAMYMDMLFDDTDMTIWLVDNVVYVDMADEKVKATNASIADIFGDNFLDELMAELPTDISEIPEAYMKKMESAQIYSYKGTYYFSVKVSDAEAVEMELGEKGYTETMYFNSDGSIKKIVSKSDDATMTILIRSYGKAVDISAPKNADEFVEKPTEQAGAGKQDPETYAVYEQLLDKIENATSYMMNIEMNGEPYIYYECDGKGGYYTGVTQNNSYYEVWLVNGQGYVSTNYSMPVKTNNISSIQQSISSAASLKNYVTDNKIHGDDMSDLTISNISSYGEKTLSFTVYEGTSYYIYSFTYGPTYVDVFITNVYGNGSTETLTYTFDIFDVGDGFEVSAPI